MRKLTTALAIAFLLGPAAAGVHAAGGGPMPTDGGGGGGGSPAQVGRSAESRYNKGLKKRDSALQHEAAAAKAGASAQRDAELAKAVDDWNAAIAEYKAAVAKKADFYQAYGDMGYAYRKLGNYDASLAAYDDALALNPDYPQAIEYQGEAFLGVNRLDAAKSAYMHLFALDRPLAARLMEAFSAWTEKTRTAPPAGIEPAALEAFATWVRERRELAGQAGEVSSTRSW